MKFVSPSTIYIRLFGRTKPTFMGKRLYKGKYFEKIVIEKLKVRGCNIQNNIRVFCGKSRLRGEIDIVSKNSDIFQMNLCMDPDTYNHIKNNPDNVSVIEIKSIDFNQVVDAQYYIYIQCQLSIYKRILEGMGTKDISTFVISHTRSYDGSIMHNIRYVNVDDPQISNIVTALIKNSR